MGATVLMTGDFRLDARRRRFYHQDMKPREWRVVIGVALAVAVSACGLFPPPTMEESFQESVVSVWVAEGVTFMTRHGSGPITVSTETAERTWSVEYPDDATASGQATGQLRITELAAYPLYANEDFARRVHESGTEVDRRGGLTQEAWRAVTGGQFAAIAHLRGEVTRSTGRGTERVEQHAVLPPVPEGVEAVWEFKDRTRSIDALWRATDRFYDRMMRSDDRVLECAKGTDPSSNRPLFLQCAVMLLDEEFGG